MTVPPGESVAEEERQLMHAAQADLTAFAPLYERYFPQVYRYCLRRVADPQEAEDLTSLVFARALRSVRAYRGGSVRAWLFTIAHNAVVNHYRDDKPRISLEVSTLEAVDGACSPADSLLQSERTQAIRNLVATLPPDDQLLLALKIDAGLTAEEIGQAVGKKPGTVRVALHRIIKRLRALYLET
jgi:RNA polymerase sigma-70 factor (ECF subfamily)